jgi:hypothetical protein
MVRIVQEAGWSPGPAWTGAENLAYTGIPSPDRPTRSLSLYRLRYPTNDINSRGGKISAFGALCNKRQCAYVKQHYDILCCSIFSRTLSNATFCMSVSVYLEVGKFQVLQEVLSDCFLYTPVKGRCFTQLACQFSETVAHIHSSTNRDAISAYQHTD